MKRLFISQPMKGKTDEEILKVRNKAIASAKKNFPDDEDVEVIDSFFRTLRQMQGRCGFWENPLNCYRRRTLHISQKAGRTREGAGLKIPVLLSMGSM